MKKILFYFALLFFANHAYTQKNDDSVISLSPPNTTTVPGS